MVLAWTCLGVVWPLTALTRASLPLSCTRPGLPCADLGLGSLGLVWAWAGVIMGMSGYVLVMVWCGYGMGYLSEGLGMGLSRHEPRWYGLGWAGNGLGMGSAGHMLGIGF
jgi:hypothetical protein